MRVARLGVMAWWMWLIVSVAIVAVVGYLAMPFDLVPDFMPVAGQLDDVLVVAFVLRRFLRSGGEPLVREHWPGPEQSLRLVLRAAGA